MQIYPYSYPLSLSLSEMKQSLTVAPPDTPMSCTLGTLSIPGLKSAILGRRLRENDLDHTTKSANHRVKLVSPLR